MRKRIDLTGTKIWDLEVLEEVQVPYTGPQRGRKTLLKLKCRCSCGEVFYPFKTNVLRGATKKCLRCANLHSMVGQKIGKLSVLNRVMEKKGTYYECVCDCGEKSIFSVRYLKDGLDPRCEKCRYPKKFAPKSLKTRQDVIDDIIELNRDKHKINKFKIVGKRFGKLKVLSFSHWYYSKTRRRPYYKCKCKCGNIKIIRGEQLGTIHSCGCFQKERIARGEKNYMAVLKNSEAASVKELLKSNLYTQRQIAKMFGVSDHVISAIKKEKTYKSAT